MVGEGDGVAGLVRNFGKRLVTRFNSWDAIYFVSAAKRGYVYEQEWAFGTGLVVSVRGVLGGKFLWLFSLRVEKWMMDRLGQTGTGR